MMLIRKAIYFLVNIINKVYEYLLIWNNKNIEKYGCTK